MEDWTIRRADRRDADGLAACLEAAYAEAAARIADLPDMTADCEEEIATREVWVAQGLVESAAGSNGGRPGAIAGALVLAPADGFMLLANVAVRPGARGAGLGRRLLALAEAETLRRGWTDLRLTTHVGMTETIGLYLRNGWVETGRQGAKVAMRKVMEE